MSERAFCSARCTRTACGSISRWRSTSSPASPSSALFLLAVCAFAARKFPFGRETLFLLAPCMGLSGCSHACRINMGIRHILPLYVLLTICWEAPPGRSFDATVPGLISSIRSPLSARLHCPCLSCLHRLCQRTLGWPSQTYKYLNESNVDWAQQLKSSQALSRPAWRQGMLVRLFRRRRD